LLGGAPPPPPGGGGGGGGGPPQPLTDSQRYPYIAQVHFKGLKCLVTLL
jgi:hypothetical protein